MANLEGACIGCGIQQLYYLYGGEEKILLDNARSILDRRAGAVVYSDVVNTGNGERLTAYIRKNGLGQVIETPAFHNPKYRDDGNIIKVYTWMVDRKNLPEWLAARKAGKEWKFEAPVLMVDAPEETEKVKKVRKPRAPRKKVAKPAEE